jgi:hypothetical protein
MVISVSFASSARDAYVSGFIYNCKPSEQNGLISQKNNVCGIKQTVFFFLSSFFSTFHSQAMRNIQEDMSGTKKAIHIIAQIKMALCLLLWLIIKKR